MVECFPNAAPLPPSRSSNSTSSEAMEYNKVAEFCVSSAMLSSTIYAFLVSLTILGSITSMISVVVFSLMRQLTGDPTTKMFTDMLVIFLLVVLNVAVMVLFEFLEQKQK